MSLDSGSTRSCLTAMLNFRFICKSASWRYRWQEGCKCQYSDWQITISRVPIRVWNLYPFQLLYSQTTRWLFIQARFPSIKSSCDTVNSFKCLFDKWICREFQHIKSWSVNPVNNNVIRYIRESFRQDFS